MFKTNAICYWGKMQTLLEQRLRAIQCWHVQSSMYWKVTFERKQKWSFKKDDLLKEVKFIWPFHVRTRKGWPFDTCDCLSEVTSWTALTGTCNFLSLSQGTFLLIFILFLINGTKINVLNLFLLFIVYPNWNTKFLL